MVRPLEITPDHDAGGLDHNLALGAARIGRWSWDPLTDTVTWDEGMEACYGLALGSFDGTLETYLSCVHPDDRAEVASLVARAREEQIPMRFEHRAIWPDGSEHWLEARGAVVRDADGVVTGMVGVGIDIDERKELQEIREYAAGLTASAELAAQLEDAERIAQLGSWYWDQSSNLVTLSREMARLCGIGEQHLTGQQFREMLSEVSHPEDRAILVEAPVVAMADHRPFHLEQRIAGDDAQWRIVVHRGEVVVDGNDTVVGIRGTTQDVTEQRAAERALAVAHENLAHERRAVHVLQETLIRPEFPEIDGYEIGARYLPAAEEEIGGDWYDAFALPDGRILFSVGDVSGHGVRAARIMAKLRHSTRAYALADPDPLAILERLDRFLGHFAQQDEMATVVLGVLDPRDGRVRLASAGHLPPVHVKGSDACILRGASGLLLGTGQTPAVRVPIDVDLAPGDALVLYTDGLVERRAEGLDAATEALGASIRASAPATADMLVVAALDGCLAGRVTADDVCVLALRRV